MDRRNGGDPLAPPRPPKLQPRVHRPRAPEPTTMNGMNGSSTTTTTTTPQCTNNNSSSSNNIILQAQTNVATAIPAAALHINHSNNNYNICNGSNSRHLQNISNSNSNSGYGSNVIVLTQQSQEQDDGFLEETHHLTFLPQRPASVSRNSSHVSSTSASSSTASSTLTAANSFTRRRPPPPPLAIGATSVPLLNGIGGSQNSSHSSNSNSNNFFSHFQSAAAEAANATTAATPASVTLAQPRPESERLANEYVDTPLRNAIAAQQLQLQHASRVQHPAGQHDGQTTTHHLLLLPQRQQQQQQHSSVGVSRATGTAGSATAATTRGNGVDGTDAGFLHSHHHHHHPHSKAPATTTTSVCAAKSAVSPPITKQPASNVCKFASADSKQQQQQRLAATLDDLFDLPGVTHGAANTLGMPIIGDGSMGADGTSALNPITCPRCDRCRCEQCQIPRPLPQTWLCDKTCLCSAESVIDYASCLCCAKALFYHCARDNDMDCDDGSGTPCVDNPCSCGPYKRTQRWGWLSALSLVLPCLWCYWPMRGCMALCEQCYGRYAGRGCRCQQIGSTSSMLPIVQIGVNGAGGPNTGSGHNGTAGNGVSSAKSLECSNAASRILRKGDLTPEKRLLDSSPEY